MMYEEGRVLHLPLAYTWQEQKRQDFSYHPTEEDGSSASSWCSPFYSDVIEVC